MSLADFQPIISAAATAIAGVIATLIGVYTPRLLAAIDKRTGVMTTAQDRAAVMQAVTTGVGLIQTRLDLGLLRPVDVHPSSPAVVKEAELAIAREAEQSAPGEGATVPIVAAMIAARVDTTPRAAVVAAPVPLAAGT